MKPKSLRQLAREGGASASYLFQVKKGKRPPSGKWLNMLSSSEATLASGRTTNPLDSAIISKKTSGH